MLEIKEQPNQDSVAMADYMALAEKYAALKAQRAWVGLTPEEIHAVIRAGEYDSMEEFACVIESKLRSKNHA